MRRILIWLGTGISALLLLGIIAAYVFLRGSAPQLNGEVKLSGLSAPVTVNRDHLGVPTIIAHSRLDAVRVLGYLHAQDRFFQMDLMRRLAAGELAALVGPAALKVDERHRLFRLRAVAQEVLQKATPEQRIYIQAYTDGVNAGLHGLRNRPFEYALLWQRPRNWQPADSVLVIFAMYFDLQDAYDKREADLALMRESLPAPLFEFLYAPGTRWDAPLIGPAFTSAPIPSVGQVDIHAWPAADFTGLVAAHFKERPVIGSNSFAVDAAHSTDGHAILANDMHLGLAVPNIWYRAQLTYPDQGRSGSNITTTGVTLPGVPVTVVGSNGHVAWGFTNSYGDWVDRVMLHLKPDDPTYYLTPGGWRAFSHHQEVIRIPRNKSFLMDIRGTIWGPVPGQDHNGIPYALNWVGEDPAATNLELSDMDSAQDVQQAMAIANHAGIPEQNFLAVDADGNIGWTIAGQIPVRTGYDPNFPAYWDKAGVGWSGWLPPARYPRIVNPTDGRLWTANTRTVDGGMLKLLGDGGYDLGARAQQIRDDLMAKDKFSPAEMLAIELDDRAVFLERWRSLLLQLMTPARIKGHARRTQFLHYIQDWGGKAKINSVGYRLVRDFRLRVDQIVFGALTAPCRKLDPDFDYGVLTQREGPLWAMVTQQPHNLLDPEYQSWNDLMLAAVDHVDQTLWLSGSGFTTRTWGQRNTVRIQQPMSRGLHILSHWLNMAPVELPGDSNMPRVQGVHFGASERLDVEPGHEQNGIFEMPTGQSGYPLSPFYRNSQRAWELGQATGFLPGATRDTLAFQPSG